MLKVCHNEDKCEAKTKKGPQCSRRSSVGSVYCKYHAKSLTQKTNLEIQATLQKEQHVEPLSDIDPRVRALLKVNESMPEQRTKEWYERRNNMITASPAGAYLKITDYEYNLGEKGVVCLDTNGKKIKKEWIGKKHCNCFSSYAQEIERKCCDVPWMSNKYMRHGVKYEDVICKIFEEANGKKCWNLESCLIRHYLGLVLLRMGLRRMGK